MLERIINITAGSDYKQSTRPSSRQINAYRQYSGFSTPTNDSVLLSPASAFLSSIDWRLKKIVSENEKIEIVFSFDEFEFSTHFFLADLIQNQKVDYGIKYQYESFLGPFNMFARISTPLPPKVEDPMQLRYTMETLHDFVKSVFKTDVDSAMNYADNFEVQKIFSDLDYLLKPEFDYLNNCLVNFIEKYLSIKLNIKTENNNAGSSIALNFLQFKKA